MANIIKQLKNRMIESRGIASLYPCKVYKTEANAEKAAEEQAQMMGIRLDREGKPADYLVIYMEDWGVWTAAINMTELMRRPTCCGGYVGSEKFFTF